MKTILIQRVSLAFGVIALIAILAPSSHAQLNLVAGTDSGFVQLNSVNTAAGGALPVFDAAGRMLQSGGSYPQLLNINTAVANFAGGLVPGLDSGQVGANGNFGGGRGSVFAQDGAGAVGIFSNAFNVVDANPPGAVASVVDFGGTSQFTNAGAGFNFFGGSFGTVFMDLTGKGVGSYGEFGIRGRIEVGVGQGANFVPVNTFDSFLSYGFGIGVLPYAAAATSVAGTNQVTFATNAAGTATVFRGYAFNNVFVPAGATVRMTGTLTIFGDPATVVVDTSQDTATVLQSSAPVLVPESSSLQLVLGALLPILGIASVTRRKRITD